MGHFSFWISLSLRLRLSPKFGLRPRSAKKWSQFSFGFSESSEYCHDVWYEKKLECCGYPTVKKFWRYVYSFWQNSRTWQTDSHTPHDGIASRGNWSPARICGLSGASSTKWIKCYEIWNTAHKGYLEILLCVNFECDRWWKDSNSTFLVKFFSFGIRGSLVNFLIWPWRWRHTSTLTPMHLRKAKLMFFYVRYPSSAILKVYFPDVKFNKNNTAQLVKWFSNFRWVLTVATAVSRNYPPPLEKIPEDFPWVG